MKKILAFILALCMIFSLVACGGEPEVETEPAETEAIAYAVTETVAYEVTEPAVEETLPLATEETIGFVPSPEATIPDEETFPPEDQEEVIETRDYIINASSGKIHKPYCSSVDKMKESNKRYFNDTTLEALKVQGYYDTCDRCNPQ